MQLKDNEIYHFNNKKDVLNFFINLREYGLGQKYHIN